MSQVNSLLTFSDIFKKECYLLPMINVSFILYTFLEVLTTGVEEVFAAFQSQSFSFRIIISL